MARASRAVADQHRTAIEQASARLFRQHGLHGVSVAQVMADAGLTHGGFYGHFGSKDELAAVACARSFAEANDRWQATARRAKGDVSSARRELVERYLSAAHRDAAGHGCPASAFASDVAREPAGKPVREAYLDGLRQLIDTWEAINTGAGADAGPDAHRQALVQLATFVGAITLARATAGDGLSDEILDAARAWLLDSTSNTVAG
ncbi:TetR/AcrR family transcriptional regulator [Cupriavidus agavae]|uniref:TetR family transcriptional regulator n=1 Tax=Cupriavidus agavae TaxID=1001822 RepID=A0A4V2FH94_9BURK|nr:TetR/AcrR family transcriptional regulator [Cupriavidus agavae]RZT39489.1 TetR family transcriptional regulator [Cupriavidus agavae]